MPRTFSTILKTKTNPARINGAAGNEIRRTLKIESRGLLGAQAEEAVADVGG